MNGGGYQHPQILEEDASLGQESTSKLSPHPKNYYPEPLTPAASGLGSIFPAPHQFSTAYQAPPLSGHPPNFSYDQPHGSPKTLSFRAFNSNDHQSTCNPASPLFPHGWEPPLPPLPPLAKSYSQQSLKDYSSPGQLGSRFYLHHNQTDSDITGASSEFDRKTQNRQKRMGVLYGLGSKPANLHVVGNHESGLDVLKSPGDSMPSTSAVVDGGILPNASFHPLHNSHSSSMTGLAKTPRFRQSRRSNVPELPFPIDLRALNLNEPDSAPNSSSTTTLIRDLITPPTPFGPHSVPQSPKSPLIRGLSMPKLFGGLKSQSRSSKSRSSSPSLASRIGSSISNRLASRFGSRASTRGSSPTRSSALGDGAVEEKFLSSVVAGVDDDWPEFLPRRLPNSSVVSELGVLGSIHGPLLDIDAGCRRAPLNVTSLSLNPGEEFDIRGFLARGVYYYQRDGGTADKEGNYQQVRGEHIGYRYRVENLLGRGSFGTVLQCRDHKSGRMVAVKVTANRRDVQSQSKIESNLLRALMAEHSGNPEKHHFVRLLEYFRFKGHLCIVTELLGPNLYELLKRGNFKGLEECSVKYITRQICEGLEFLAESQIIHCDLKPENVLVSDVGQCQIKIIDFGSSCYAGKRLYTYIQSRFYRAPEILLGMPYSCEIDMWSLGTIVPELLLGKPLLPSVDENDQVALISQIIGPLDTRTMRDCSRANLFFRPNGDIINLRNAKGVERGSPGSMPISVLLQSFSADAIDFVEKILQWSPQKRLSAKRAVYHPFILTS